jgi:hypothetical protein
VIRRRGAILVILICLLLLSSWRCAIVDMILSSVPSGDVYSEGVNSKNENFN